jgi:hypothetical protein
VIGQRNLTPCINVCWTVFPSCLMYVFISDKEILEMLFCKRTWEHVLIAHSNVNIPSGARIPAIRCA